MKCLFFVDFIIEMIFFGFGVCTYWLSLVSFEIFCEGRILDCRVSVTLIVASDRTFLTRTLELLVILIIFLMSVVSSSSWEWSSQFANLI